MELVDTRDLKSLDRNIVPVQVRPRVPHKKIMKYWLVATYKIKEVKKLELNLSNQKFDYYLPTITIKSLNSVSKEELLFPGYIFVNTAFKNYSTLKYTVGIKNVIKFGDNISFMPDKDIATIQMTEELSKTDPLTTQFHLGQEAVVKDGSLKGTLVKICSLSSKDRVGVLLNILGSSRKVIIPKKDLVF